MDGKITIKTTNEIAVRRLAQEVLPFKEINASP